MTVFSEEVKRRIVVELASFRTTTEVIAILMQEYDLLVLPKEVGRYDPTKGYYVGGAALAELFHATRARAVEDISQIPIAHLAYRLRSLQRLAEAAERIGNLKLAARLIEQAAKEVGGCYVKAGPAAQASPAEPEAEPAPDPAAEPAAAGPLEAPAASSDATDHRAEPAGGPEPEGRTEAGPEPAKAELAAPDAAWDAEAALRDRVAGVTG